MSQFKTIDRSPASVSAAIKAYRADCTRVKAEAEKHCHARCHIVGRGVEIIALDETGERNDDLGGPDYISAKELTVGYLKAHAQNWAKHYSPQDEARGGHRLAAIHLAGGFDIYENFGEYMQAQKGDWMDYDIYEDWAGQDIAIELLVPAEETKATPKCFMCPADAEYLVHGHNVCEACATEIC